MLSFRRRLELSWIQRGVVGLLCCNGWLLFTAMVMAQEETKEQASVNPPAIASPQAEVTSAQSDEADATTPSGDAVAGSAQPTSVVVPGDWLRDLPWRSLGPANMGGRVTDLEVHAQDHSLWWIATASGGLLKTTNRGTSVQHQFDREATVSIGAIASDPNDKSILWVGTGEINPRNSVSYGNGLYRSGDGGRTFTHVGLDKTYQIAKILVHPQDSQTVYVGAAGRLYGPNPERGVYKTTDGGQTWEQVLYLDERTGVIDMIMHPADPNTLIVAMWDRLRDGYDSWPGSVPKPDGIDGYDPIRKWGPKAGLYKTSDGGKNWKRLSQGLPSGMIGRVGLDWQTKSPHTIYAVIDCENIGKGPVPGDAYLGLVGSDVADRATITQILPGSPAADAGFAVGDVIRRVEEAATFQFDELLEALQKKIPGERIRIAVQRGDSTLEFAPKLLLRPGTQGGPAEPYLGLTGKDAEGTVEITEIIEGGPAALAGLQTGDRIVAADIVAVQQGYSRWIAGIRGLAIGDTLQLQVKRGETLLELPIRLGRRPGSGPASNAIMGVQGRDAEGGGALLTTITPNGPAAAAGLEINDVVTQLEGKTVETYQALLDDIRTRRVGDEIAIEVKRGEKLVKAHLVLARQTTGSTSRPYTFSYFGQQANIQDQQGAKGHEYGGVYKSTDAGETWQRVNSLNVRPMYFSVVRVDPSDDQRVYLLGVSQYRSTNGGTTFTGDFGRGVHSDCHDLWINPEDGRHIIIGSDGGFYATYDRGATWDHINTAAVGQFYHVAIAPTAPYRVYGGLQDNGSWGGPAIGRSGGSVIQDWISVGGGDGFVCRVDPADPDLVYSESQNGAIRRRHLRTGESASIRPPQARGFSYRFNWNTPFILSHHNSKIFYSAGNYVFRSVDRGNDLKRISPEITLTDRGSATALAESPLDSDVLYVGTDDGGLWRTKDGGNTWENITANLGVSPRWVATIEPSRQVAGRVYVCLDAHRSDDDRPYVFVSEDFGDSFKSLGETMPLGSSRCLREDVVNPNLLYLGTEFGFWVSLDRGQNWTTFNQKLPTVAVHEVAMHPGLNEIVLATHGRSLWACDVSSLRSLTAEALTSPATLLPPSDVIRWRAEPSRGRTNRQWVAENPESGTRLWFLLNAPVEKSVIKIENIAGRTLAELPGPKTPGLHSVRWNLTQPPTRSNQGSRQGAARAPQASPAGEYRASLFVDDKIVTSHTFELLRDPTWTAADSNEQQVDSELETDLDHDDADQWDAAFLHDDRE